MQSNAAELNINSSDQGLAASHKDKRDKDWGYLGRAPAAALIALALTGCATTQYKYIPTYCVTRAQLDQLKKEQPGKVHDQLTGDASKDVGILAGSAIRLRAYSDGLLEVLGGCVDPNAGAVAK